jgi:hypothetical protein
MLQVHDLVQTRPQQVLLAALVSLCRSHQTPPR